MFWAVRQLTVPCKYLRIKSGPSLLESKFVYDNVLPVFFTAATVGLLKAISVPVSLATLAGVQSSLSNLLALLIGFYMAALAAVATFDRPGIDNPLRGDPATLRVRMHDGGQWIDKPLSYRQFISYLFGYLSFLSLILYGLLLAAQKVWPRLLKLSSGYTSWDWVTPKLIEPLAAVLILYAIWQLIIVSLLGIYFLAERIQSLNDPEG